MALDRSAPTEALRGWMEAGQATFYQADMGDREQVAAVAGRVLQTETALDGLVNNVGVVLGREDTLETMRMEDLTRSMDINVYGPMELTRRHTAAFAQKPLGGHRHTSPPPLRPTRRAGDRLSLRDLQMRLYDVFGKAARLPPGGRYPRGGGASRWMRTALGGGGGHGGFPAEVAVHVLDILCGKQVVTADPAFVNRFGEPIRNRNDI